MMNIFINNIDNKLFPLEWKELEEKVLLLCKKIKVNKDHTTIYYVTNEPVFGESWKIITSINNIKVLISDNFPYILRQMASHKKVTSESIVISNNMWELYLSFYIKVYTGKNNTYTRVTKKKLKELFSLNDAELQYMNDYIFLQEKNSEDSLGKKKTITLLKQYEGLNNLYANRNKIDNIRSKASIDYQANRIKFYIDYLQPIFLTPQLIIND